MSWRKKGQPTPIFLPEESHGQRRLAGYSPWGRKSQRRSSDWTTTTRLTISVQLLSRVQLFATQWTTARQASLSITNSQSFLNSCPLSRWCHPTIWSSVIPFSSRVQPFPGSGSFPVSQFVASGGQSIGVSASTSVLPMNIQDWFPLGSTGWISLQCKGIWRVISNTTVQKHQFFSTQLSCWSNFLIHTWLLEKP